MPPPRLLLTILVSGATCLFATAISGEEEPAGKQRVQQEILQEVRTLRKEVAELRRRLSEMESTLKALNRDRQTSAGRQDRPDSSTPPVRQSAGGSRDKYPPRLYWDSLSENRRDEHLAAERTATRPLRKWSLSQPWTVHSVFVAKDNQTVLAGGERGEWRLGDIESGEVLLSEEHPHAQQVHQVAISPDGQTLALDSDKGVYIVARTDPAQERFIRQFQSVWSVAFSPDGKLLALAITNGTVQVLRVEDFSLAHEIKTGGHFIRNIRFSADGRRLAVSGGYYNNRIPEEGEVTGPPVSGLWDLATGLPLFEVQADPRSATTLVAELVPGQSVLVVHPRDVSIWSLPEKKRSLTIRDRADGIADVSADGDLLLLAVDDDHLGIYDTRTGELKNSLQIPYHWRADACLSPDGRYVVAGGREGGIRVWDLQ